MSSERFDIIFRGDILPGHTLSDVKQRLAQLFKADEARINALFVGSAVPLKRDLDQQAAEKYQAVLTKVGADVSVRPAGQLQAKQAPRPRSEAPVTGSKPTTLQERLAAIELPPEKVAFDPKAEIYDPDTGWSVAALGAELLEAAGRVAPEVPVIDTSNLSLRLTEGNLVDAVELPRSASVTINTPDYGIAAVGAELLREDEKPIMATLPIAISDFGVAPPGSNLGQITAPPAPPPPDTSAITLAD